MTGPRPTCTQICPVRAALDVIGGKWKGLTLYYLTLGPLRFSELQRQLSGITQRMLTLQLRELEADGLVHREVHPVVPPRVDYSLTEKGETLRPILQSLRNWGLMHLGRADEIPSALA